MRWPKSVTAILLVPYSVLAAPMDQSSSTVDEHPQLKQYRQFYDSQLTYLGLLPNPGDSRQILLKIPLEVKGLHTFVGSARANASDDAKNRAAKAAVQRANSLGDKIKDDLRGPLHPDNVGRQFGPHLSHVSEKYNDLLNRINHNDNGFAYGQIFHHPDINSRWVDYAISFIDLVEEASPLVIHQN